MEKTAVIVGTGNVAYHLTKALLEAGVDVLMVYGRSKQTTEWLGRQLNIKVTSDWNQLPSTATYYLYAISDNALPEVLSYPLAPEAIHLHTAGSIGLEVFPVHKPRHGVLYPLQTFSKTKQLNFKEVPLFVEASSMAILDEIRQLAATIAYHVNESNSTQRRQLHLAAVFACNFVNHMYAISDELVRSSGLPFEVLKPLIAETASKITLLSPREAQTGPAVRGDSSVMDKHKILLENFPSYKLLYEMLSSSISNF